MAIFQEINVMAFGPNQFELEDKGGDPLNVTTGKLDLVNELSTQRTPTSAKKM